MPTIIHDSVRYLIGELHGLGGEEAGRVEDDVLGVLGHDAVVVVVAAEGHHLLAVVLGRVQHLHRSRTVTTRTNTAPATSPLNHT